MLQKSTSDEGAEDLLPVQRRVFGCSLQDTSALELELAAVAVVEGGFVVCRAGTSFSPLSLARSSAAAVEGQAEER